MEPTAKRPRVSKGDFSGQQLCDKTEAVIEEISRGLLQTTSEALGPVTHHLESYEHFIQILVPRIIAEFSEHEILAPDNLRLHRVLFERFRISKPLTKTHDGKVSPLFPSVARTSNQTYSAQVSIDVIQQVCVPTETMSDAVVSQRGDRMWVVGTEPMSGARLETRFCEVPLFEIPVMLRSSLCWSSVPGSEDASKEDPLDPGGYFLVKHEKVLIGQEKPMTNFPYVHPSSSGNGGLQCEVRSLHEDKIRSTSTIYLNMSRQSSEARATSKLFTQLGAPLEERASLLERSLPTVNVLLPFMNGVQVPLLCLYRMLGFTGVEDILAMVGTEELEVYTLARQILEASAATEMSEVHTCRDAFLWTTRAAGRALAKSSIANAYSGTPVETVAEPRTQGIKHIIVNEFLPHIGSEYSDAVNVRKAWFLTWALQRLLRVELGLAQCDDRDDYALKRIETSGILLGLQLRQLFRKFTKYFVGHMRKYINSYRYVQAIDCLNGRQITMGLFYALVTGMWGMSKGGSTQVGVAQMLNRINVHATISHLRTLNTPLNREGKQSGPRQLHQSSFRLICPFETPEGKACGLIKTLAQTAYIRIAISSAPLLELLQQDFSDALEFQPADEQEFLRWVHFSRERVWFLVNGVPVARVLRVRAASVVQRLREVRRSQQGIEWSTSIFQQRPDGHIEVRNDVGALLSPLVIVERLPQLMRLWRETDPARRTTGYLWRQALEMGLIEYLDKAEEMSSTRVAPDLRYGLVAWSRQYPCADSPEAHSLAKKIEPWLDMGGSSQQMSDLWSQRLLGYTHCEMHTTAILGICGAQNPFPNHNQMPRNMYQVGMAKQSMGQPGFNHLSRVDTNLYSLNYPQKPLVSTFADEIYGRTESPTVCNVVVAIMTYGGWNLDDAIIINQSAVDRGLFSSSSYRTFRVEDKHNGVEIEQIGLPSAPRKPERYSHLDVDGLPSPGQRIEPNQILVAKTMKITNQLIDSVNNETATEPVEHEQPIVYRADDPAYVDRLILTETPGGQPAVKLVMRTPCIPEIGDKFASRHGQKGVIGMALRQEDMPFDMQTGITPDMILNPHCMPRRMTVGQAIEMFQGKLCAITGRIGDATPFCRNKYRSHADEMQALGFQRYGNTRLCDGATGRLLNTQIFMGVMAVQRLKHVVRDKIHARARGPVNPLTRQPVEGRSRDGGLRLGEMERDVIIANGVSSFLTDRFIDQSDALDTAVCRECGLLAELEESHLVDTLMSEREKQPRLSGTRTQNPRTLGYTCRRCRRHDTIDPVRMPYVFKLMATELMAMGVCPRFQTESSKTS